MIKIAAGDTEVLNISQNQTEAEVKAAIEAKFTVGATDIFITANHGAEVRIIQIKTA